MSHTYKSDIIITGGGLAGIVTAVELLDNDQKVIILERDKKEKFGGLAKKSFGGIMMVGTPYQKKTGQANFYIIFLKFSHVCGMCVFPKTKQSRKQKALYVNTSVGF